MTNTWELDLINGTKILLENIPYETYLNIRGPFSALWKQPLGKTNIFMIVFTLEDLVSAIMVSPLPLYVSNFVLNSNCFELRIIFNAIKKMVSGDSLCSILRIFQLTYNLFIPLTYTNLLTSFTYTKTKWYLETMHYGNYINSTATRKNLFKNKA